MSRVSRPVLKLSSGVAWLMPSAPARNCSSVWPPSDNPVKITCRLSLSETGVICRLSGGSQLVICTGKEISSTT